MNAKFVPNDSDAPWKSEPDHERWTDVATGYECSIVRHTSMQHLCGYVGLPADHPWFRKHYDDARMMDGDYVEAHGGLTYAHDHAPNEKPDGLWWLGFDCAHLGDYSPDIGRGVRSSGDSEETYKTWAYVRAECETLASQAKRHADAMRIAP